MIHSDSIGTDQHARQVTQAQRHGGADATGARRINAKCASLTVALAALTPFGRAT